MASISFSFTLLVPPRTKKTHNRLISFGRPCAKCGRKPHQKVAPSEAFEEMEASALALTSAVRDWAGTCGVQLPITGPVSVKAIFHRDRNTGDVTGYENALADIIQEGQFALECPKCQTGRRIAASKLQQAADGPVECKSCGHKWRAMVSAAKQARRGMGIIGDDRQIIHWDGTRLAVDSARPRIEVLIRSEAEADLFSGIEEAV
jgi:predicted Zn finger-like uncharacterized protein